MNKSILVLNTLILVVNFVVSFASSELQGKMLETTSRSANVGQPRILVPTGRALSQVLTTLQSLVPATQIDALSSDEIRKIESAIRHYKWMAENSASEAIRNTDGRPVRERLAESSKDARDEIERMLGATLNDHNMVRQVTTAIIRVA